MWLASGLPGFCGLGLTMLALAARSSQLDAEPSSALSAASAVTSHNIVERPAEPASPWPCPGGFASECVNDYLKLARRSGPQGEDRARCRVQVADELALLHAQPPQGQFQDEPPLPAAQLGAEIRAALSLDELTALRGEHPLAVISHSVVSKPAGFAVEKLFLEAEPVGRVPLVVLRPEQHSGPLPVVLALPGHNTEAEDFLAETFPNVMSQGYMVVTPTFRGYHGAEIEHQVSVELLCAGRSFLGVRHFEVLLILEYLRALQARGEAGPIALLGHSGGAGIANAMLWYQSADLVAVASDLVSNYLNVSYPTTATGAPEFGKTRVMCESNAALHKLAVPISNFGIAPVPVGQWPYGYTRGREFLWRFLGDHFARADNLPGVTDSMR